MKPAETTVFTAATDIDGFTADVQTHSVWNDGNGVTAYLELIQTGPRGGLKFIRASLTDDQRRQLIENLGGTVAD